MPSNCLGLMIKKKKNMNDRYTLSYNFIPSWRCILDRYSDRWNEEMTAPDTVAVANKSVHAEFGEPAAAGFASSGDF